MSAPVLSPAEFSGKQAPEQLLNSSHELLIRTCELIAELREEAPRSTEVGSVDYWSHFERYRAAPVARLLDTIALHPVTGKEAKRLQKMLSKRLPSWLNRYVMYVIKYGPLAAEANSYLGDFLHQTIVQDLNRIVTRQTEQRMSKRLLASGFMQEVAPAQARKLESSVKAKETKVQLPAAALDEPQLRAAWRALGAAWIAAEKVATQVEDRFRIEQIANAHLPESLRMYASLRGASAEAKAEASELLEKQFQAMERQLAQISQRYNADALVALRAQTDFIQVISAREGRLAITGGSA